VAVPVGVAEAVGAGVVVGASVGAAVVDGVGVSDAIAPLVAGGAPDELGAIEAGLAVGAPQATTSTTLAKMLQESRPNMAMPPTQTRSNPACAAASTAASAGCHRFLRQPDRMVEGSETSDDPAQHDRGPRRAGSFWRLVPSPRARPDQPAIIAQPALVTEINACDPFTVDEVGSGGQKGCGETDVRRQRAKTTASIPTASANASRSWMRYP
jgi:hypothetical protein